jgi:hypothetical protein
MNSMHWTALFLAVPREFIIIIILIIIITQALGCTHSSFRLYPSEATPPPAANPPHNASPLTIANR